MIVPDPESPGGERAKVLDFGIAKVLGGAPGVDGLSVEQSSQTRTGTMVGTPLYMAPEQCRGGGNITDKIDVYAMGVMLYRMLCGRPPFMGEGAGAVMAMHIYEPPPPLRQQEPSIPEDLATLVHHLLAKEPTQRPPMAQVAAALEQLKLVHGTGTLSQTDLRLAAAYIPHPSTPVHLSSTGASGPIQVYSQTNLSHAGTSAPSLNLTLGQSAAQISPPTSPKRSFIAVATVVGSVVAGAALFGILVLSRDKDREGGKGRDGVHFAARPLPGGPAHKVKWSVSSEPAGAQIVRATDQRELGRTPWQTEQPSQSGALVVILRLPGYADRVVSLDQTANVVIKEPLQPLAAAAPSQPAQPEADPLLRGKGLKRKGKAGKAGTDAPSGSATATAPAAPPSPAQPSSPPVKEENKNGRIQVVD